MGQLYLRQLLAGRDFAKGDVAATQMVNFAYLVGDSDAGRCLAVDPAWAPGEICDIAEADGMKLEGALVTHYHPDHVGGKIFGLSIAGLGALVARNPCKVHVHRAEGDGVRRVTGLDESDLVRHDSGDRVKTGDIEVELLHTPGHTPGSQCFRVGNALLAGDTLFLQGCGRVDLPGGDPDEMYRTLTQRLSTLPADTILYPGHAYGGESADMGTVRRTNPYLRVPDLASWRRLRGA